MYMAKHIDALSHPAIEAHTTTLQPCASPMPTRTTILVARNHIDESDAINIIFGISALVVAIFAIFVGIYYGRQQAQRLSAAWGQLQWPRAMAKRPRVASVDIILGPIASHGDEPNSPAGQPRVSYEHLRSLASTAQSLPKVSHDEQSIAIHSTV
ncbi:hypothetical protein LTR56_002613 [Elasticomyces elasticus]|nr:hypothetical protein LTR22_013514 [Elasticomyces elasticus]KAK3657099.1 hypothetical protein LTR56_002613 [Elasticomyces elasticus]KAK4926672.1 hypothetical protein LTR49_006354 [Elasticomyces elasticus]KAK5762377.1 hypothetical protein LTS12_007536 [Elasticomyces elasticus]